MTVKATIPLAIIGKISATSFHTSGYVYASGVSEAVLGILSALAGLMGLLGAVIYPRLRMAMGLKNAGVFGLTWEVSWLTLPVISMWLPGSQFHSTLGHGSVQTGVNCSGNISDVTSNVGLEVFTPAYDAMKSTVTSCTPNEGLSQVSVSIIVFLVGIVASRLGKAEVFA